MAPRAKYDRQTIHAILDEGPALDATADLGLPVWAGVLPLEMSAGDAETADGCEHDAPGYVRAYARASVRA